LLISLVLALVSISINISNCSFTIARLFARGL
jgi:hypothetical protein